MCLYIFQNLSWNIWPYNSYNLWFSFSIYQHFIVLKVKFSSKYTIRKVFFKRIQIHKFVLFSLWLAVFAKFLRLKCFGVLIPDVGSPVVTVAVIAVQALHD